MAEADEDPDDFLAAVSEKVRDGDDETLVKLRALVRADLESASPDASLPIAAIGRDYVRGECPSWAARGWVRLLSEVSSREIDALRTLATMTRMSIDAYGEYLRRQRENKIAVPEHDGAGVAVIMSPATFAVPGQQDAQPESLWVYPTTGSLGLTSGPGSLPDGLLGGRPPSLRSAGSARRSVDPFRVDGDTALIESGPARYEAWHRDVSSLGGTARPSVQALRW